ncbi:hypothetical protein SAMN05192574_105263 [Mucilaginibacter gossypiicola]|uniref:ATPase AAA-type core domain-containing protein n=1 Tax=Mucilaginibacter gossypiicola TaxID=551995 RepID=A0A1H8LV36_9SPHI|nr:ATP-binding protein [Mucilaginibacter gossypiicola]SEO08977.1 hypothetical protein SAMN05192574_105263 [Mucilaginibacter gossypiicola]
MLVSFAVTNFRSIRERVQIDMVKSGQSGMVSNYFKCGKKQLLRSAVIYGPNASGKSSFLRAIKAAEYLVLNSADYKLDEDIEPYEPHTLDRGCRTQPVVFEMSFVANKQQYDYLISVTEKRIESEELYYYPANSRSLLYSRVAEKEIKFGDYYKGPKKVIEKLLSPNQLFLSKAAENNVDSLMSAYRFFSKGLTAYPMIEEYAESNIARLYAKRLAEDKDSKFSKRFNKLICALDTGIASVSAKEIEWKDGMLPGSLPEDIKKQIREDYKYEIRTQHFVFEQGKKVDVQTFDVRDESAGTKSLFVIGGIILEALDNGRVLVVDEFEKNLHPSITHFLIQLFHNPIVNKKNAQLIFATHDITQLSTDHFRRDQVWFTEKNEYGATSFYRCSEIPGIRLGTPLDKWYASGRFGATPIINDVDFLIEMQADDEVEA